MKTGQESWGCPARKGEGYKASLQAFTTLKVLMKKEGEGLSIQTDSDRRGTMILN